MEGLAGIVEISSDPTRDGVIRWRRVDLKRVTEEHFGVVYRERAVSDRLRALCFSDISGWRRHPRQDPGVLDGFKNLLTHACRAHRQSA